MKRKTKSRQATIKFLLKEAGKLAKEWNAERYKKIFSSAIEWNSNNPGQPEIFISECESSDGHEGIAIDDDVFYFGY